MIQIQLDQDTVDRIIREQLRKDLGTVKREIHKLEAQLAESGHIGMTDVQDLEDFRLTADALTRTIRYYSPPSEWDGLG